MKHFEENHRPLPADVIYHEGPCIVVNKAAGVATQAPIGIPSVEMLVRDYIREQEGKAKGDKFYLGIPHRLDRPVTGVLVFGRHVRATKRLADQFAERSVEKSYWALVDTSAVDALEPTGTWRDWLRKVPGKAQVVVGQEGEDGAKHAVLHYEVGAVVDENTTLLKIRLETGRTHQIRVQCASRGLPILGDSQYGSTHSFGPQVEDPRRAAIALHARHLKFQHPMTREPVEITANFPEYWPPEFVD